MDGLGQSGKRRRTSSVCSMLVYLLLEAGSCSQCSKRLEKIKKHKAQGFPHGSSDVCHELHGEQTLQHTPNTHRGDGMQAFAAESGSTSGDHNLGEKIISRFR